MELALTALAPPRGAHPVMRLQLASFEEWHRALHGAVTTPASPPALTAADLIADVKLPIIVPETETTPRNWSRVRKIFTSIDQDKMIKVDDTIWHDEFRATGDWNAKPSRVETFLARYDKNQTLTTLVFVALLLLWIF